MNGFPVSHLDGMPLSQRARVEDALRRVAIGAENGMWAQPEWVKIRQSLSGGYSGALVLRIEVIRGAETATQIAKIGAGAFMEWEASEKNFARYPYKVCPRIVAVTKGVLDPDLAVTGADEAVIYADIQDFAKARTSSLDDLAQEVSGGDQVAVSAVVQVIDRLFRLAADVFYNKRETTVGDRSKFNASLGPDLKVRVDRLLAGRSPRVEGFRPLGALEVLRAGLAFEESAGGEEEQSYLPPGTAVALLGYDLRPPGAVVGASSVGRQTPEGHRLAGCHYITVEIELPPGNADVAGQVNADIYGTLEYSRAAHTWERIKKVFPSIAITGVGAEVDGVGIASPFAALGDVLTEVVPGFVTSMVHGDLNPRNVLVAGTEPYLIDYAAVRRGPILRDLAWLELNLLRGPFAPVLDFPDVVRLQRLLALGDQISARQPGRKRTEIDQALIEAAFSDRAALAGALRIAGTIRRHAAAIYQGPHVQAAQPWWREYAAQLLLLAHRMFKWHDDMQGPAAWRVQLAVAAVATEQWLGEDDPWRFWPSKDRATAADAVLRIGLTGLAGLALYSELSTNGAFRRKLPRTSSSAGPSCGSGSPSPYQDRSSTDTTVHIPRFPSSSSE